ncbi:hypothetical protein BJX61DRAFT_515195 [Aspergillus egyptiacus]|nr:hypothetical protein BJX61DRAFT_515195 [Aspergillus egyptiacus]
MIIFVTAKGIFWWGRMLILLWLYLGAETAKWRVEPATEDSHLASEAMLNAEHELEPDPNKAGEEEEEEEGPPQVQVQEWSSPTEELKSQSPDPEIHIPSPEHKVESHENVQKPQSESKHEFALEDVSKIELVTESPRVSEEVDPQTQESILSTEGPKPNTETQIPGESSVDAEHISSPDRDHGSGAQETDSRETIEEVISEIQLVSGSECEAEDVVLASSPVPEHEPEPELESETESMDSQLSDDDAYSETTIDVPLEDLRRLLPQPHLEPTGVQEDEDEEDDDNELQSISSNEEEDEEVNYDHEDAHFPSDTSVDTETEDDITSKADFNIILESEKLLEDVWSTLSVDGLKSENLKDNHGPEPKSQSALELTLKDENTFKAEHTSILRSPSLPHATRISRKEGPLPVDINTSSLSERVIECEHPSASESESGHGDETHETACGEDGYKDEDEHKDTDSQYLSLCGEVLPSLFPGEMFPKWALENENEPVSASASEASPGTKPRRGSDMQAEVKTETEPETKSAKKSVCTHDSLASSPDDSESDFESDGPPGLVPLSELNTAPLLALPSPQAARLESENQNQHTRGIRLTTSAETPTNAAAITAPRLSSFQPKAPESAGPEPHTEAVACADSDSASDSDALSGSAISGYQELSERLHLSYYIPDSLPKPRPSPTASSPSKLSSSTKSKNTCLALVKYTGPLTVPTAEGRKEESGPPSPTTSSSSSIIVLPTPPPAPASSPAPPIPTRDAYPLLKLRRKIPRNAFRLGYINKSVGFGLIATKPIAPGTIIFVEKVISILHEERRQWKTPQIENVMFEFKARQLGDKFYEKFKALPDMPIPVLNALESGSEYISHGGDPCPLTLREIWDIHHMPLKRNDDIGGILGLNLAWVNHSCIPNCNLRMVDVYPTKTATVKEEKEGGGVTRRTDRDIVWRAKPKFAGVMLRASKAIQAGEQITIAYIRTSGHVQNRREQLVGFQFKCACWICLGPQGGIETAMREYANVENVVTDPQNISNSPSVSLQMSYDLLGLLRAIGLYDTRQLMVWSRCAMVAGHHSDLARARCFLGEARQLAHVLEGKTGTLYRQITKWYENPTELPGFGVTQRGRSSLSEAIPLMRNKNDSRQVLFMLGSRWDEYVRVSRYRYNKPTTEDAAAGGSSSASVSPFSHYEPWPAAAEHVQRKMWRIVKEIDHVPPKLEFKREPQCTCQTCPGCEANERRNAQPKMGPDCVDPEKDFLDCYMEVVAAFESSNKADAMEGKGTEKDDGEEEVRLVQGKTTITIDKNMQVKTAGKKQNSEADRDLKKQVMNLMERSVAQIVDAIKMQEEERKKSEEKRKKSKTPVVKQVGAERKVVRVELDSLD